MDRNVILQAVVGSTAYGLATPASDQDRLGVFLAPTTDVLGLHGPSAIDQSDVRHDPDVALHELAKFVRLALRANPTVLELLWATDYDVRTDTGDRLVETRDAFLSTKAVRAAYTGYAIQQARRLAERTAAGQEGFDSSLRSRTAKHGRHCFRLLLQGRELLTTGEMTLDVSARRDEVFAAGDLAASDPAAFAAFFERELAAFDALESVLPAAPDAERANTLVVEARLAQLATRV